jgi:hypothetical protein
MYDVFFISYEEPTADENWSLLKSRMPHARRIHGVKGISAAHQRCARQSFTKMFWTVDGDTVADDDWKFDYMPPEWDQMYLHLWYSRNPVNGLSYGYGAIKLWPKAVVLSHSGPWLDFTTSIGGIKIMDQTIATTVFNSSPYESWKSAFRESIKLMENIRKDHGDLESKRRLDAWKNPNIESRYAEWCSLGLIDAEQWYGKHADDLTLINDFGFLRNLFGELHGV